MNPGSPETLSQELSWNHDEKEALFHGDFGQKNSESPELPKTTPHRDSLPEYEANTEGSRTEDGDKFLTRSTKLDPAMPEAMPNLGFFRSEVFNA